MSRKAIGAIAVMALMSGALVAQAAYRGDIDGDGSLTLQDTLSLLKMVIRSDPPPCEGLYDFDGDGRLSVGDVIHLLQAAMEPNPPLVFVSCPSDEETPIERLLRLFSSTGEEAGVSYDGQSYWLQQAIGSGRYVVWQLENVTTGGYTCHQLGKIDVRMLFHAEDEGASTFSYGGEWSHGIRVAQSWGGSYSYSKAPGATVTFTTSDNTRSVGVIAVISSNGGVVKAEIDGDPSRANQLQTAQQLVNDGTLDKTVLVSNGGSLDPTDRMVNLYKNTTDYSVPILLADDLSEGTHTVRLTYTGYKTAAATSPSRIYLTGSLYSDQTESLSTNGVVSLPIAGILSIDSVSEYALHPFPRGALHSVWVGNGHGYEQESAFAIIVDGHPTQLSPGQTVVGRDIAITRQTVIFHPDMGTTPIGSGETVYHLAQGGGLELHHRIAWTMEGCQSVGYTGMFAFDNAFDWGSNVASDFDYDLVDDDGSVKGNAAGQAAYAWMRGGHYGVMLYVPDLSAAVADWRYTPTLQLWIEDRHCNPPLNKIYLQRGSSSSDEPVRPGDVWDWRNHYFVQWFADADQALVRP